MASHTSPEYNRAWKEKNREHIREYKNARRRYLKFLRDNPDHYPKQSMLYAKDLPSRKVYLQNRYKNIRMMALQKLGGVCVICGFSDDRALQIDHIHGGGNKDRKQFNNQYDFLKDVLGDSGEKYQLLCANCNWIKRSEKNENYHGGL